MIGLCQLMAARAWKIVTNDLPPKDWKPRVMSAQGDSDLFPVSDKYWHLFDIADRIQRGEKP